MRSRRGHGESWAVTVSDTGLSSTTASRLIAGRQMILLLLVSFGSFFGFYLLLSVVPLYAAAGGAGASGAGAATGVMMLATVLMELAVARLVAGFGYRTVASAGLLMLAASAAALTLSERMPLVLAVCLLRGAGLAIVAVVGPALTAELVPVERRGEGLGLYGVAVGVPAVIGLPLGVWLSSHLGFHLVFLISGGVSVATLVAALGLPAQQGRSERHGRMLGGLRGSGLVRPAVIFAAFTVVAGVVETFLSLAMPAAVRAWVPLALLAQTAITPFARWGAGRLGDRRGSGPLLVPAVLTAAIGTAGLVWVASPIAVIAGMALFGIGFGIGQNATLALMLERVPPTEFGKASALWNLAFDGGFGIGAVGFGLLSAPVGYPTGFAVTALVLVVAIAPAWRDRRGGRKANHAS
ncbi:MFS transporter [Streptomyces alanosinicus]|uniref:MFS transporter n=1 Tax=Streptomyces alanosinicus TaxID=68171 RepID=A0A918YSB6_9ACTN|nr:MFS transporter [Streptomyces alanosinicus]